MRRLFSVLLIAATPLSAQMTADALAPRVSKLEGEMRAVQRKVFPGGDPKFFVPEIAPPVIAAPEPVGTPATSPLADLNMRVDGLERQQRDLTGAVEALQFKQRQLDEQLTKFRADAEFRMGALEGKTATDTGAVTPPGKLDAGKTDTAKPDADKAGSKTSAKTEAGKTDAAKASTTPATTGLDPIETAWRAAYAPVAAKDYAKAEPALLDFLAKNPKVPRAASAQYWLGRTYMAQNQSAQAAKAYLDGYQKYPKSDRAADSLLGLGSALAALKKPDQACRAYNELQSVYGAKLTPAQKDAAAKARTAAKCDA